MTARTGRFVFRGMLVLAMALQAGFNPVAYSQEDDEEQAVEVENQSLDPTKNLIVVNQNHHHGGNMWEQEYNVVMGAACGAGRVRNTANVWHTGNGHCWSLGWTSPDVTDCHVTVRIRDSAGWVYGDCHLQVEAAPANSCAGYCGKGRTPGGCYCDAECRKNGDCCRDYPIQCR